MKLFPIILLLFFLMHHKADAVITGADQPGKYLHLLRDKRVGLVVNQTSIVGAQHLVDFLLNEKVDVKRIFAPEHGFRGDADAGETISSGCDKKTGLPIISLYGKNKKPTSDQLKELDIIIFDIQDVGIRFYTYISTMHYVMEACAENNLPLLILDRPNPNGDYIAGPVLEPAFRSFVGMHPIPVVHGCTIGELAQMINGEGWLDNQLKCPLTIVPVAGYTHQTRYELPVRPSPNLPNFKSVRLYPSLCFFEATYFSIGRGTHFPFQAIGFPDPKMGDFSFVPKPITGMDKNPKQMGKTCYGRDFREDTIDQKFSLSLFIDYYRKFSRESDFLESERWFNLLAGTDKVLAAIRAGKTDNELELLWEADLNKYKSMRQKYLIYPDKTDRP